MLYFEDYVIVNKGLKRDKNQDNIYVNGLYLRENNNGLNNYEKKNNCACFSGNTDVCGLRRR